MYKYKYNGKSTVDYVLLSPLLLDAISNFFVDTLDKCLSDAHPPICTKLQMCLFVFICMYVYICIFFLNCVNVFINPTT